MKTVEKQIKELIADTTNSESDLITVRSLAETLVGKAKGWRVARIDPDTDTIISLVATTTGNLLYVREEATNEDDYTAEYKELSIEYHDGYIFSIKDSKGDELDNQEYRDMYEMLRINNIYVVLAI